MSVLYILLVQYALQLHETAGQGLAYCTVYCSRMYSYCTRIHVHAPRSSSVSARLVSKSIDSCACCLLLTELYYVERYNHTPVPVVRSPRPNMNYRTAVTAVPHAHALML